jgi:hypothetical protein
MLSVSGLENVDGRFLAQVCVLPKLFEQLMEMPPFTYHSRPNSLTPTGGIYLFSENDRHLYVGRTNNVKRRLSDHCGAGSGHNAAPFAFILARKATGHTTPSYQKNGLTRKALMLDLMFCGAFEAAKERIALMHIRYVPVSDSVRQALLEVYMATVLQTEHNDFDNH